MSEFSTTPASPDALASPALVKACLPVFAAVLFLSATLLFWVQPLFAKMVLPLLGGSPSVWNTAMLFFQTMLLGGYAYAHLLARYAAPRTQLVVQLGVLVIGLTFLPFAVGAGVVPPDQGTPVFWLFGLFAAAVGMPFFALSANAPLLQSWFSRTGHAHSADPYFLYGASNLGSIMALLAFPFFLEPQLGISGQTLVWKALYVVLAGGIGLAGLLMLMRAPATANSNVGRVLSAKSRPSLSTRLHWLVLAFVPSSLLLGVTTYISTDIASAPLLWVIPLVLYLLTFVNVFARRPLIPHRLVVPVVSVFAVIFAFLFHIHGLWSLGLHLVAFFLFALLCHGELARRRPDAQHLTEFYLTMSAGGMLGGVANALVAPVVFNMVYEYPLAVVLACLLIPAASRRAIKPSVADFLIPAGLFLIFAGPAWIFKLNLEVIAQSWMVYGLIFAACFAGMIAYTSKDRPLRFGLSIGALLFGSLFLINQDSKATMMRSFFGVYRVTVDTPKQTRTMSFGTTLHGAQYLDPATRKTPLTYFTRSGPLGQMFEAIRPRNLRVLEVGLGVGTVACYAQPGDDWTFYEIDPLVDAIARNENWFTFMSECAGDAPIIYGDARLKLADAPPAASDLIILDAFSSDAIPIHLVTREAFALYVSRLAEGGIILVNTSNRYLDIKPVISAIAEVNGLTGYYQEHVWDKETAPNYFFDSNWVVLAREEKTLETLAASGKWTALPAPEAANLWTDDYSDLIGALK